MARAMKKFKKTGKRGRPRGFGKAPREFQDRFQKFYYLHRERLNEERRKAYRLRKAKKLCVRCTRKAVANSVFCRKHREQSHV